MVDMKYVYEIDIKTRNFGIISSETSIHKVQSKQLYILTGYHKNFNNEQNKYDRRIDMFFPTKMSISTVTELLGDIKAQ